MRTKTKKSARTRTVHAPRIERAVCAEARGARPGTYHLPFHDARAPLSSAYLISLSLPFTLHRLGTLHKGPTQHTAIQLLVSHDIYSDGHSDTRRDRRALDKCNTLARHETLRTASERPSSHLRRGRHPKDQPQPRPIGASVTHLQMWIARAHTHIAEPCGGSARAAAAGTQGRARQGASFSPRQVRSHARSGAPQQLPDPRGSESLDIAGGHSNVPLSAKVGPT